MNNSTRYTIAAMLSLILTNSFAQTVAAELKKVRTAYTANKDYSFDVEVYSYETKEDKTPSLVSKGYAKKGEDKYYSNFKNYELVVNGEKALIVDNQRRTLTFYEYKKAKKDIAGEASPDLDSLMAAMDSTILRPTTANGQKHLTSFSKKGYIRQTEIYIDPATGFISNILYYYVGSNEDYEMQADRIQIYYKNIQMKAADESFFSFDKYFIRQSGQYLATGKYKGYRMKHYNSKS